MTNIFLCFIIRLSYKSKITNKKWRQNLLALQILQSVSHTCNALEEVGGGDGGGEEGKKLIFKINVLTS